MKYMLISDYDNTLYLNDIDMSKNIISIDKFRKNNYFIISTGRSYIDFKKVHDKYKFNYDYVILNHGSIILDSKDNILYNTYIDNNIINSVKENLDLEDSISYFCSKDLESRVDFNNLNINKINIKYKDEAKAIKINNLINFKYNKYVISYHISKYSIEIISSKTNKSKAINYLIKYLDFDKSNVYTIGDSYSDISMIKDYNGSCMNNSVKELLNLNINKYDSVSSLIDDILKKE